MPPRARRYSVAGNPREEPRQCARHARDRERERPPCSPLYTCPPILIPVAGGPRSYATGHSFDANVCIRSRELRSSVYAPNHAAASPVDLLSGDSESIRPTGRLI